MFPAEVIAETPITYVECYPTKLFMGNEANLLDYRPEETDTSTRPGINRWQCERS